MQDRHVGARGWIMQGINLQKDYQYLNLFSYTVDEFSWIYAWINFTFITVDTINVIINILLQE